MTDRGWWRGRRVLLTGHTGFKGAWLAAWLHRLGASVTGFGAAPPSEPALFALARGGEWLEDRRGDVRDGVAVAAAVAAARPEVVLHLAAQALVRESLRDPVGTFAVNVLGTATVLDAVRAGAPGAAVVVVTSDKVYADPGSGRRLREGDPLGGHDPYSASKAAQEHVAATYRDAFGLRVATARAGNVIGGGDWARDRVVPDLARAAAAGAPLVLRSPEAVRPWQHVLNPLDGYVLLAERLAGGGEWARAWNFGPGGEDERTVAAVVDGLRARWPGAPRAERAVDADAAAGEAPVLRLDSAAARGQLGWRPAWDLDRGLDATAAWYAAHAAGADARELVEADLSAYEAES